MIAAISPVNAPFSASFIFWAPMTTFVFSDAFEALKIAVKGTAKYTKTLQSVIFEDKSFIKCIASSAVLCIFQFPAIIGSFSIKPLF